MRTTNFYKYKNLIHSKLTTHSVHLFGLTKITNIVMVITIHCVVSIYYPAPGRGKG